MGKRKKERWYCLLPGSIDGIQECDMLTLVGGTRISYTWMYTTGSGWNRLFRPAGGPFFAGSDIIEIYRAATNTRWVPQAAFKAWELERDLPTPLGGKS